MDPQIGKQWWQVVVDRHDRTPPYLQIAATIRHKIATGELAPGSPLPSVRQLVKIAGVTSTTVTRSYHLLREEGLVSIQPGIGAIVEEARQLAFQRSQSIPSELVDEIDDLVRRVLQQGYASEVLERTIRTRLQKATSSRYVVFTTAEAEVSEHYASVINAELSGVGIRCIPVPYATLLRASEETKGLVARAEHVFTTLPIFREVEEAVGKVSDAPVSHLLTQITLATHERLRNILPGQNVALIFQRRYRASVHGLMLGYVNPEHLHLVRSLTKRSVESALNACEVVVHTVGTRSLVLSSAALTKEHELIEPEYAIRPDVLDTIRELFNA